MNRQQRTAPLKSRGDPSVRRHEDVSPCAERRIAASLKTRGKNERGPAEYPSPQTRNRPGDLGAYTAARRSPPFDKRLGVVRLPRLVTFEIFRDSRSRRRVGRADSTYSDYRIVTIKRLRKLGMSQPIRGAFDKTSVSRVHEMDFQLDPNIRRDGQSELAGDQTPVSRLVGPRKATNKLGYVLRPGRIC